MSTSTVLAGIFAGLLGTLIMDVWSAVTGKLGLVAKPSSALLGRWVSHIPRRKFVHKDIRKADKHPLEGKIGMVTHYAIGAVLGILFIVLVHTAHFSPKNYFVAAGYGFITCIFAWFLMFPSFGFGVFGTKAPAEAKLLRTSTINHIIFGISLAVFFNLLQ